VQTALGAIVVLTTTTINRVMAVELALPALLPGLLVGLHYAIQITRPKLGYKSDLGGKRTPWIIGGMAVLALGGVLAALSTLVASTNTMAGVALAIVAFTMVGVGVGCSGTALLVLLAKCVTPKNRGGAATTVWIMMIVGFIFTTVLAGKFLDPFSYERLVQVTACVSAIAFLIATMAVWGIEKKYVNPVKRPHAQTKPAEQPFMPALKAVWRETESRKFSIFVFVSMLAYSAQDLILEPFAGAVFGMTPGESTQLSGTQHGGVLLGMLLVALFCSVIGSKRLGSLRTWTVGGCIASAAALLAIGMGGVVNPHVFPLNAAVFILGLANGAFAVAAIGSMMALVGQGMKQREGLRMGLWGAAQAIAFGIAGVGATALVDITTWISGQATVAYGFVFILQAVLFIVAARLAKEVYQPGESIQEELSSTQPRVTDISRFALEQES